MKPCWPARPSIWHDSHREKASPPSPGFIAGDFSVRVAPISRFSSDESFNQFIACFNRMAQELASVETLRTDFIANVSHELKTPLAAMSNYATLLQSPALTQAQRMDYAKAIVSRGSRLMSGQDWSFSHLLTACGLTRSIWASSSCFSPRCRRSIAILFPIVISSSPFLVLDGFLVSAPPGNWNGLLVVCAKFLSY